MAEYDRSKPETGINDVSATYITPGGEWWKPAEERWPTIDPGFPSTGGNITIFPSCSYCDAQHESLKCPRLKSIEYHDNGSIKRVEFKD